MSRHVTIKTTARSGTKASARPAKAASVATRSAKTGRFTVTTTRDVRSASRHATGEVIATYREALSKLAKH